jgi:LysM repeat protein
MPRADQPIFSVRCRAIALAMLLAILVGGCDRMITSRGSQAAKDADAKVSAGNFSQAVALYESALDGTAKSADIHYRLGVLYDDKLNDPLHALHHFKRYLALAPTGPRAADVKNFIKRDELALVTSLSGDALVSRGEAVRLKNENLALHKQIEDARTRAVGGAPTPDSAKNKNAAAAKAPHGGRTYTVHHGDTLASISRKFYKSSAHWKRILDANRKTVDDPENLKVGETLTIP